MQQRFRGGVVVCPIWRDLPAISGSFEILVHYQRTENGVEAIAAFTRYKDEIVNICDKFRTLNLVPDWRTVIAPDK